MKPEEITLIRQAMPEYSDFTYFAGRESLWLLAARMPDRARVADLRQGPLAPLLEKPSVRPLVAGSGGVLDRRVVAALASGRMAEADLGSGLRAAFEAVWSLPWRDYAVSFGAWGTDRPGSWAQMSRSGGNLVVQLGFPSEHAALLRRLGLSDDRKWFESVSHPVRHEGWPTLAWARLDIDFARQEVLIEEVQCDWLRYARRYRKRLERTAPQTREARNAAVYEAELATRYGKEWPQALLLAVLQLAVTEFGCRVLWMHTPEGGARLKRITGREPPASLYSQLPKSFGFALTDEVPNLLVGRNRALKSVSRQINRAFWRLDLSR